MKSVKQIVLDGLKYFREALLSDQYSTSAASTDTKHALSLKGAYDMYTELNSNIDIVSISVNSPGNNSVVYKEIPVKQGYKAIGIIGYSAVGAYTCGNSIYQANIYNNTIQVGWFGVTESGNQYGCNFLILCIRE